MLKSPQFVTDEKGRRIGVMLSLKSYEKLLAASEEAADITTYRKSKPKIMAEIARGEYKTLSEYQAKRAKA
jgi:hypothetical protein